MIVISALLACGGVAEPEAPHVAEPPPVAEAVAPDPVAAPAPIPKVLPGVSEHTAEEYRRIGLKIDSVRPHLAPQAPDEIALDYEARKERFNQQSGQDFAGWTAYCDPKAARPAASPPPGSLLEGRLAALGDGDRIQTCQNSAFTAWIASPDAGVTLKDWDCSVTETALKDGGATVRCAIWDITGNAFGFHVADAASLAQPRAGKPETLAVGSVITLDPIVAIDPGTGLTMVSSSLDGTMAWHWKEQP